MKLLNVEVEVYCLDAAGERQKVEIVEGWVDHVGPKLLVEVRVPSSAEARVQSLEGYLQQRCAEHPQDPQVLVCVHCFESDKTAAANERAEAVEARVQSLDALLTQQRGLVEQWRKDASEANQRRSAAIKCGDVVDANAQYAREAALRLCADDLAALMRPVDKEQL